MTTPVGTITLLDIQSEFGGAAPIALSEYYAGGLYVPASTAGVPSSGAISMGSLRGKSKAYVVTNGTTASEGSSITFYISTNGIPDGTLYYSLDAVSGSFNAIDVASGSLTGSVTTSSGAASVTVSLQADATTEGVEAFRFNLRTGSTAGAVVATGPTVSITDSSANPTYALSFNPTTIGEGQTTTWTLTTTDVPAGTTLWMSLGSGGATLSDFAGLTSSNFSFTATGGVTTGTLTAAYDTLTESGESATWSVRATSGTSGPLLASAALAVTQALGTVGSLHLTQTGGTPGQPSTLFLQVASIAAYPVDRTFSIQYVLDGAPATNEYLSATTIAVPANATSSSKVAVFYNASANQLASLFFLTPAQNGHSAAYSNQLSNVYI